MRTLLFVIFTVETSVGLEDRDDSGILSSLIKIRGQIYWKSYEHNNSFLLKFLDDFEYLWGQGEYVLKFLWTP